MNEIKYTIEGPISEAFSTTNGTRENAMMVYQIIFRPQEMFKLANQGVKHGFEAWGVTRSLQGATMA